MATTPEGKVKLAVKAYLRSIGAWYYMPVPNGMGRVGCPDFLVCWRGLFIAIETKAPGKRENTTANQVLEIRDINRAGGFAFVVDDVSQVKDYFDAKIFPPGTGDQEEVQRPPRD